MQVTKSSANKLNPRKQNVVRLGLPNDNQIYVKFTWTYESAAGTMCRFSDPTKAGNIEKIENKLLSRVSLPIQ